MVNTYNIIVSSKSFYGESGTQNLGELRLVFFYLVTMNYAFNKFFQNLYPY